MFDSNPKEHYLKRGDPNKPTYYICRRKAETTELFALYRIMMGHVRYALSNGWLPVVDMQNYPNLYLPPEKLGKENSWEYFFEQPLRIGLEEAYNGDNIILSNSDYVTPYPIHSRDFLENKNLILTKWRMLVKLGLLKIKPELMQEILLVKEKLFSPEDRVLGVYLRGADYAVGKIKNYPIPPPVEFAAMTITEKLKEWRCNKFFLATEDKALADIFKSNFVKTCTVLSKKHLNFAQTKNKSSAENLSSNDSEQYRRGKEYLIQIALLSSCNALVGVRGSGTTSALLMAEKFEHTWFFNLGRYGVFG